MRWASAGHPAALLVEPDGRVHQLSAGLGVPIAAGVHLPHEDGFLPALVPGSTLILYTDGLVERRGVDLTDSIDELAARASKLAREPIRYLCDRLLQDAPTSDDIALLAVRVPVD
ncbi:MAG: PP2C family protein-serine/threonine phosphatase [Sporichthyaceae bacterium]